MGLILKDSVPSHLGGASGYLLPNPQLIQRINVKVQQFPLVQAFADLLAARAYEAM